MPWWAREVQEWRELRSVGHDMHMSSMPESMWGKWGNVRNSREPAGTRRPIPGVGLFHRKIRRGRT